MEVEVGLKAIEGFRDAKIDYQDKHTTKTPNPPS